MKGNIKCADWIPIYVWSSLYAEKDCVVVSTFHISICTDELVPIFLDTNNLTNTEEQNAPKNSL